MVLLVKALSIAIIIYGCVLVLRPGTLKKVFDYISVDNRIYTVSVIKGVIGLIMLLAAASCRIPWIVFLLGGLTLLGVILAFVFKKEVLGKVMTWLETRTSS